MKKINLIVGLCFLASTSFAGDFSISNVNTDKISSSMEAVKEAVANNKYKLEAELMIKEAMLAGIEYNLELSEAASNSVISINEKQYQPMDGYYERMVVALPPAAVGFFLNYVGAKLSHKALKAITPSAEKANAYRAAWKANRKEIKLIEKALKKTKAQYRDTTRAQLTNRLTKAKAAKLEILGTKPSSFYRLGRFTRVAGTGAIVVTGIAGFLYVSNGQIIFAARDLGQLEVDALKSSIADIDAALELAE